MAIEFTCLACTRTFSISIEEMVRSDYLSCIGCGRPVPVDLLEALKRISQNVFSHCGDRNNDELWHIRFKAAG